MENSSNFQFASLLAESNLLMYLKGLAEFKKDDRSEERGSTLFGNKRKSLLNT